MHVNSRLNNNSIKALIVPEAGPGCTQGEIAVLQVDLADLASVHAMTRAFLAKERGPDLVVNTHHPSPALARAHMRVRTI